MSLKESGTVHTHVPVGNFNMELHVKLWGEVGAPVAATTGCNQVTDYLRDHQRQFATYPGIALELLTLVASPKVCLSPSLNIPWTITTFPELNLDFLQTSRKLYQDSIRAGCITSFLA